MKSGLRRATPALALAMLGVLSAPGRVLADEMPSEEVVVAEEPAPACPECKINNGNISITAGLDLSTAYFFRGILQERDGFIAWPYASITFKLWENDTGQNVSATIGSWNSVNSNKTFASGSGPGNWFESDVTAGLGIGLTDWLSSSLTYIAYTYPNGAFPTVQEFDVGLNVNDSKWLGNFALYPSMLWGFELDNTALGNDEGIYLQLGLNPSYTAFSESKYPVTFSLPLTVGLSVSDYYEILNEDGQVVSNDTFGYFDFGLGLSVPLSFMDSKYGTWTAKGAFHGIALSGDLASLDRGDGFFPWGTIGVSFTY